MFNMYLSLPGPSPVIAQIWASLISDLRWDLTSQACPAVSTVRPQGSSAPSSNTSAEASIKWPNLDHSPLVMSGRWIYFLTTQSPALGIIFSLVFVSCCKSRGFGSS